MLFDEEVVDKMQRILRPCHGGVDPLVRTLSGILGDVSRHMHVHVLPLPSLRLVAGDGIAIGASEGVEVRVVEHGILKRIGRTFLCDALFPHPLDEIDKQFLLLVGVEVEP